MDCCAPEKLKKNNNLVPIVQTLLTVRINKAYRMRISFLKIWRLNRVECTRIGYSTYF